MCADVAQPHYSRREVVNSLGSRLPCWTLLAAMPETMIDRWHRENTTDQASSSALRQCMTGAVRGALLGLILLVALFLIGWLGLL